MTGILITGGAAPALEKVRSVLDRADILAAADSGLLHARSYGLRPALIVGDMDSLPDPEILACYPEAEIHSFPVDKDETDTELGLRLLAERGCTRRILIGGGGGRLDHLIGILSLFHRADAPDEWYADGALVTLIRESFVMENALGVRVSFFPVGKAVARMRTNGLKWPLDTLVWRSGDGGLSNIVTAERMTVRMRSGRLIAIRDW